MRDAAELASSSFLQVSANCLQDDADIFGGAEFELFGQGVVLNRKLLVDCADIRSAGVSGISLYVQSHAGERCEFEAQLGHGRAV